MNIHPDSKYMPLFLDNVIEGSVVIPRFQRDFIWPNERIASLIDSILKGFPIGSIILWRPDEEQFEVTGDVGGIKIEKISQNASYILDGRQRVTSLISVLNDKGENADKFFVDLEDSSVIYSTKRNRPINMMRLCDVFDTFSLVDNLERIRSSKEIEDDKKKEYLDSAKKLNKQLVTYEIGYFEAYGGRIDDAVEIFSRLNSKGIEISPDYMIQALSYNKNKGFLFGVKIDEILSSLEKYNFSKLNRKFILNCIFNYTDKPFFDAKTEDIIKMDNLPWTMDKAAKDILSAVRFLYNDCNVVDYKLLPYVNQLIMLVNFFKFNPEPRPEQLRELRRWFFLTSYKSYFTNTSLTNIRRDFKRFESYCKGQIKGSPLQLEDGILEIPEAPKSIVLSSVRSCSLVLSTLMPQLRQNNRAYYMTYSIPMKGMEKSLGSIVCFSKASDRKLIKGLFNRTEPFSNDFTKYYLTQDMMLLYYNGDYRGFIKKRERMILDAEKDNLKKMFPNFYID